MKSRFESGEMFAVNGPEAASGARPRADLTSISEIMQRRVVCVTPELDLDGVMAVLLEHQIGGAPVIDREGNPIGVVSKTDVIRACSEREAMLTAGDIMTPIAVVLPHSSSIARASALMAFEGVHRIVVMDGDAVVGILSALDVLAWVARDSGYLSLG